MRTLVIFLAAALLSGVAFATTWSVSEEVDPITGGTCQGIQINSYGTYIYNWPSKHDGVYWPHTEMAWIWFCHDSGYVSFGHDFDELTGEEIEAIAAFLSEHYRPVGEAMSEGQRLWLIEEIYKLRNRDDRWWSWFHRVKANLYESLAARSRHRALPLLEASAEELEPGLDLIQYCYVIGDYYRRFGEDEKAKLFWAKARAVEWVDEDGESHVGSEYINELIDERTESLKKKKKKKE